MNDTNPRGLPDSKTRAGLDTPAVVRLLRDPRAHGPLAGGVPGGRGTPTAFRLPWALRVRVAWTGLWALSEKTLCDVREAGLWRYQTWRWPWAANGEQT